MKLELPQSDWFLMQDVRKRRVANAVWIPLRQSETLCSHGDIGKIGRLEEIYYAGSVAFYPQHRELAEKLDWCDLGILHSARPYAFDDGRYKRAEAYMHNEEAIIGVELVFETQLNKDHERQWLINQDLTLALELFEDGDSWLAANEGYVEVIRSRRDGKGRIIAIEIKAEFLRDYLAARGLLLRVAQYRQRLAIVQDATYLPWFSEPPIVGEKPDRFEARVFEVDASGSPFGGVVACYQTWRTDVDNDEDVPFFGAESNENTSGRSTRYERHGPKVHRIEGELWREEWIEPAENSFRIRGDKPKEEFSFVVDASGTRAQSCSLNTEDVGRYLWFRPTVIAALLAFRGSKLHWYTAQTGSIKCSPDSETHFGINSDGLINVYAYDIAKRPHWQQRIWAGHNCSPVGKVSSELLDSQQRCEPAVTEAVEMDFANSWSELNLFFSLAYGTPLFKSHDSSAAIMKLIHRFRVLENGGLLALAKDIARITADSIDIAALRNILTATENTKLGSLKLLEKVLSQVVGEVQARGALTSLVGVYELRLGDAHLPSSGIQDAYKLVGINMTDEPIKQAVTLIGAAATSLKNILTIIKQM